jgi:hypothetical protein
MAFMETDPSPGIPKNPSRRSDPVNKYGIDREMYVTIGISELRST